MPNKSRTSPSKATAATAPAPVAKPAVAKKAPAKTPAKAAAKKAVATPKPSPKPATKAVAAKPEAKPDAKGPKKHAKTRPVLVRDSFTMPEADFALIDTLKASALGAKRAAKKSELLRAGLQLLATLDAKSLVAALDKLETVKTGRPKKGH